jgi:hypothetical protein
MRISKVLMMLVVVAGLLAVGAAPAKAIGAFVQWQDTKDMSSGWGGGLNYNFLEVPLVSVDARVSYMYVGSKGIYDGVSMIPLEAVGKVKFGLFYGGVGLGYYIFSGGNTTPKNSFGGSLIGGAGIQLFGLGGFAELRYLYLEPDNKDDLGGKRDLSGFGAAVGVALPL